MLLEIHIYSPFIMAELDEFFYKMHKRVLEIREAENGTEIFDYNLTAQTFSHVFPFFIIHIISQTHAFVVCAIGISSPSFV